jgi:tetratricopeptide (TPR) repeat protein
MVRRTSAPTWLCLAVAGALALGAARATAAADPRELKAREAFVSGQYKEALELFAKLYAETLHPVYLRNIGRCYQNLGDPDHAIVTFRDYLRKHKTITRDERTEVEGFIVEMEELKKQRAAAGAPAPESATAPPKSTVTPLPSAPEPATSGGKPEALVTAPAAPPSEDSSPVYTRWWFWTIVAAAAVGAGLGIAAAAGAFTHVDEPSCPSGTRCTP